jgi:chorismate lyase/3-hydroxybenzoate synthase
MILYADNCNQPGVLGVTHALIPWRPRTHTVGANTVLGIMRYGSPPVAVPSGDWPVVSVALPTLGEEQRIEVWRSSTPVTMGREGNIDYASNGQVLFGVCEQQEIEDILLDTLAQESYVAIVQLLRKAGYPQLLRTWNYFPRISKEQDGLERYRRFCWGRYEAFARFDPMFEHSLPAATVIGTKHPGVVIGFLAAQQAGVPVENPRQVSAYQYPPQYSPRSPSFSRAMLKDWGGRSHLYISGTASIIGHETRHVGDVQAQLDEILRNLEALLTQAADTARTPFQAGDGEMFLKVYIRHHEDFVPVRERLRQRLGAHPSVLYLQGELCRSDLLVEIEAVYTQ